VELTRRLLTSISSLPTGAARPRRTERFKALCLACWNAEEVGGRKLELEHFLNLHGVDICLLSETILNPRQAFRLANYICHRTHRLTAGCGTAILVRRDIVHHSVPGPGHTHLEATAIQAILAGGLPVLMADDLNAKHVDWNSQQSTRRGKLLRVYANENSCLIFGPGTPTTNSYNPSTTPDVLDIVITKNLSSPVYQTSCSALSSDHIPVLIDTACRSSF
jgi:hypothetical protein